MNEKILTTEEGIKIANKLRAKNLKIVLVGGCFDILHIGHITFLEKAKKQGDILFTLVESDEHIRELKGSKRPLNTQNDRATLLSHLDIVDYVVLLPQTTDYDHLVKQIKPAIIATTAGDSNRIHKERQAKQISAKVVDVTSEISNQSTTRLINVLNEI